MKFTADLHIHSKYSRATSRDCVPEMLELWARRKGLDLIGTGDFTHPAWRAELREKLTPAEEGLYLLKEEYRVDGNVLEKGTAAAAKAGTGHFDAAFDSEIYRPRFILSAEISSIYKKDDKVRKVHNVIILPSLEKAEELSLRLEQVGNLHSDGRPILGLPSRDLLEITLEICPEAIFIPAHIWTPHFSLFGAYSGFNCIEECFEDLTPYIHALETGLSSDPPMNWRISALDRFTLVSNSDAHSPSRLAREANLFDTELSYTGISQALSRKNPDGFVGTLEFYPEEGKYHLDGHRNCKVCLTPSETIEAGGVCPVCGRRITVGVLHRVEELADRPEGFRPEGAKDFESIIPLPEAVASSLGITAASKRAQAWYEELLRAFGSELYILRHAPLEDIRRLAGPCVAEGIRRLRVGDVRWAPGYDGEYGRVTLLDPSEIADFSGQMTFLTPGPGVLSAGKKPGKTVRTAAGLKTDFGGKGAAAGAKAPDAEFGEELTPAAMDTAENHYGLNDEQWEAVSAEDRAVAVIAGPGTGKTRTLIYHIRHLIEEKKVPPAEITAVTFTNKAAAEMRQRLEEELADKRKARKVNVGTFHSICLKLLTKWRGDVAILDEFEALSIAEEIGREMGLERSARDILKIVSDQKNGMKSGETPVEAEICRRYADRLSDCGAMDFDDLLLEVLDYFAPEAPGQEAKPAKDREKERKAFRRLLVDEFQDINEVQYRLLSAWSAGNEELFVIGDPDQAIYGFRGSDPRCFRKFAEGFSERYRQIRLIRNYRSTPEILGCALSVMERQPLAARSEATQPTVELAEKSAVGPAHGETGRRLLACRDNGRRVKLLTAETPFSEALYMAKEINRMVGGIDMLDAHLRGGNLRGGHMDGGGMRGEEMPALGFSDIAVLYRTHRQAAMIEECLQKEGIPYVVTGKDKSLSDGDVRTALAFFRSMLNPMDETASRLAVERLGEEKLGALRGRFKEISIEKEKPWKLLDIWLAENGLVGSPAAEHLRNTAVFHKTMAEFLQNLTLGQEGDVRRSGGKVYRPDAVSLMTLHGSKGLEFPVVFLCGVKEGTIPLQSFRGPSDEEEERRLFYVGLTRARDELILLTSREPSPFLADVPGELTERGEVRKKVLDEGRQLSLF